jgi:hypothetical protein
MPIAPLIVLERDGHWAAALRLAIDDLSVRLVEARSWDECWRRLEECPSALVAAELTEANSPTMIVTMGRIERRFPQAALLILAERRLASYRSVLSEAGALHFITSPRELRGVKEILRRRNRLSESTASASSRLDEIVAELPWRDSVE